ncbi:MAG: hypothetical protein CK427_03995 [Leptospira sp.]|nr:MAG: hypothetical protein CK427_03995 [Leptospira sp.]
MGSKVKIGLELAELIKTENLGGKERLPNTETHMKQWCAHFALDEKSLRDILTNLRDAHYIFIINIVLPDPNLYLPSIDSYAYADPSLLNDLKRYSENRLEKTYESTFYKKKSPFQITRELFPKIKEFNNSAMGKCLNESVMLDEFIRVLTNVPFEFADQWRAAKLREIYSEEEEETPHIEEELAAKARAMDQPSGKEYIENPKSAWSKITNNFSIEFLLRIHFRKYEFEVVKKLILKGKIQSETDLKFIRDTLQLMESRTNQDPILKRHMNEMIELRRLAQTKLNILRTSPKSY